MDERLIFGFLLSNVFLFVGFQRCTEYQIYSTKGHRPIRLAKLASTPWIGMTKELEGIFYDPLRHGRESLQGRRGENVHYMVEYGVLLRLLYLTMPPRSQNDLSPLLLTVNIFSRVMKSCE
ncbi:hypothetical protein AKG34_02200 [Peribacillus butanolivorans]|nr:hypothetical protein AKG34_02200 [Peribacillus butanolivorans]